jgi:transcription elongation factor Elf1
MYLDLINQLSFELPKFKKINDNLYNFKCPVCGDSKKNTRKTRGYFIIKNDKVHVYCHNCGYSSSLVFFVKEHYPNIYDSYLLLNFKEKTKSYKKIDDSIKTIEQKTLKFVNSVSTNQEACDYLRYRCIPEYKWSNFGYINNINLFLQANGAYQDRWIRQEEGIGIEYDWGEYYQIRSMREKVYLTFHLHNNGNPKIWGLNQVNRSKKYLYVTEAVFDAVCVPNAIAMGGIGQYNSLRYILDFAKEKKLIPILVPDNDFKTNPQVAKSYKGALNKWCKQDAYKICVWDDDFKFKDINEAVMNGVKDIESIIINSSYSGLQAKLEFSKRVYKGN